METRIAPPGGGTSAAASGLAPGQRLLDRYTLSQRLGSGGFGEVWRAHDELLNRDVALKRILGGESERAAREAKAAARLSDPAIVALYEAAYEHGVCHLISELVEGETLAVLIAQDALGDEEILEVGLALCDALAHAHARGVIHRDVKPHNVLVPGERAPRTPAAKLTDFGGALLDGEQALTRTGDVLGTLAYMAPEQSDGREAGPAADLYSLALVIYEALSGENPVRAATPAATVRRIGSRLPPLRRRRRDLPPPLRAAIDRALLPAPPQRGELSELTAALAAALEQARDGGYEGAWEDDLDDEATDLLDGERLEDAHDPAQARTAMLEGELADIEP
ncbi:MAG: serine/threonine-protein kinase, partial [Solirubrobacteraceae bacterium]